MREVSIPKPNASMRPVVEKKLVVVAEVPVALLNEKLVKNGLDVPVSLWNGSELAKMKSPPVKDDLPVPPCVTFN